MTPDTCGPGYLVLFDTFAHVSSSWRTSGDTSRSVSTRSSRTLPKRGSMLNGALYEHPTWEPPTVESDCSLLLTPTATDGKGRKTPRPDREKGVGRLEEQLQLLPTPTANQRLMDLHGRSTPRQWVDGNASSDAPPLTPSPTKAS